MSVYDRKGPLNQGTQDWMRRTLKDSISTDVKERFVETDKLDAGDAHAALERAFEDFLGEAIIAAGSRMPLAEERAEHHIAALATTIAAYDAAVQRADADRLRSYEEEDLAIEQDPVESLRQELVEETEEDRRQFLQGMLARHLRVGSVIRSTQPPTAHERSAEEIAKERAQRAREAESLRAAAETHVPIDARNIAERMVSTYAKELAAHQILLGLEANYSDAEIRAQIEKTFPPDEVEKIMERVPDLREERVKRGGEPATDLGLYAKVMQVVFRDRKFAAGGFALGAIGVGALAPLMPHGLAEFGRTGDRMNAVEGAGAGVMAALAHVELDRTLKHFLGKRIYGEGGLSQSITGTFLGSSPELFTNNDKMFLQAQIEDAVHQIESIAKTSIQEIGVRATRLVALGSAIAIRMGDPRLFGPIAAAIAANTYLALRQAAELSPQDREVKEAGAEYMSVLDRAIEARRVREGVGGPQDMVFQRLEEARKRLADSLAGFQRKNAFIMPGVLFANAMLMDTSSPDFFSDYVEVGFNATNMVGEFQQLMDRIGEMKRSLGPVRELAELVNEFQEQGEFEPEQWDVELYDYKRKGRELQIPKLDLPHGSFAVVIGEMGAGKSTLLEALYGFSSERGIQAVDTILMSEVNRRAYREKIAVSNQFYAFEATSLRKTVCVEGVEYDRARFEEMAAEWGIEAFADEEKAFHKELHPSGGQKKMLSLFAIDYRLRIAPDSIKMILLDEPLSGVDEAHVDFVAEKIRSWHQQYPDKTVVLVNHHPDLFNHLPEDARILGIDKESSTLVQDESLEQARTHAGMPFAKVFGKKATSA